MTKEKLLQILDNYEIGMRASGSIPDRLDPLYKYRYPDDGDYHKVIQLRHAHWMVQETKKFVEQDRIEKAMRWLGFIQGVLWCSGMFTISQLKEHNR